MSNYTKDCIILVICSYKYDEKEYIRYFKEFITYQNKLKNTFKKYATQLEI